MILSDSCRKYNGGIEKALHLIIFSLFSFINSRKLSVAKVLSLLSHIISAVFPCGHSFGEQGQKQTSGSLLPLICSVTFLISLNFESSVVNHVILVVE